MKPHLDYPLSAWGFCGLHGHSILGGGGILVVITKIIQASGHILILFTEIKFLHEHCLTISLAALTCLEFSWMVVMPASRASPNYKFLRGGGSEM